VLYSIAVDLGQVRLRARADGPELIGGTLLASTHWEGASVAGLADGEVVASDAVIAALGAAVEHASSATPFHTVHGLRAPPS
jgi:hypothetical protein